jgi:hypothetical protein
MAIAGHARRDRHAHVDLQLPHHVDDVVPEERCPGRRQPMAAQPAEDLAEAGAQLAESGHGHPLGELARLVGAVPADQIHEGRIVSNFFVSARLDSAVSYCNNDDAVNN